MRHDNWSEEEDVLLVDSILNSVRTGGTQTAAYTGVATRLGRTASACAFRWNSVLRKKYSDDLSLAKIQSKKTKVVVKPKQSRMSASLKRKSSSGVPTDSDMLTSLSKVSEYVKDAAKRIKALESTVKTFEKENKRLSEQLAELQEVKRDFDHLMEIMKRNRMEKPGSTHSLIDTPAS